MWHRPRRPLRPSQRHTHPSERLTSLPRSPSKPTRARARCPGKAPLPPCPAPPHSRHVRGRGRSWAGRQRANEAGEGIRGLGAHPSQSSSAVETRVKAGTRPQPGQQASASAPPAPPPVMICLPASVHTRERTHEYAHAHTCTGSYSLQAPHPHWADLSPKAAGGGRNPTQDRLHGGWGAPGTEGPGHLGLGGGSKAPELRCPGRRPPASCESTTHIESDLNLFQCPAV